MMDDLTAHRRTAAVTDSLSLLVKRRLYARS